MAGFAAAEAEGLLTYPVNVHGDTWREATRWLIRRSQWGVYETLCIGVRQGSRGRGIESWRCRRGKEGSGGIQSGDRFGLPIGWPTMLVASLIPRNALCCSKTPFNLIYGVVFYGLLLPSHQVFGDLVQGEDPVE